MPPPTCKREVQKLTGRLAALTRFIPKSSEQFQPFFNAIRKSKEFDWTTECQTALNNIKAFLTSPPLLAKPSKGDTLLLYLAVSRVAVSSVLVKEVDKIQHPIYFTSKILSPPETRYPKMEKLALSLISAARKLRPYFQSHPIVVVTSFPLRTVLHSPDHSGRLMKWAIELGEFDITYRGRTAVKSQALADFLVEIKDDEESPSESRPADPEIVHTVDQQRLPWTLEVDGANNNRGTGLGILLRSPEGKQVYHSIRCEFKTTNNEAEYEALIAGLTLARSLSIDYLIARSDSLLIVNQVKGTFLARDQRMIKYSDIVRAKMHEFKKVELEQIPRDNNIQADALANFVAAAPGPKSTILFSCITSPAIDCEQIEALPIDEQDWRTSIVSYLSDGTLPGDKKEADRVKAKAARHVLISGELYKRSLNAPLLRCVGPQEATLILTDLHEGLSGNHSGGRSLAFRTHRAGYYWPTLRTDAAKFVEKCDKCQRYAHSSHLHPEPLNSVFVPWPFYRWGMDIVGPFPMSQSGRKRFILVATDYFTKWVEAEAYEHIREKEVNKFIWRHIVCRFGVPKELITDNGPQFASEAVKEACQHLGIHLMFSTPRYPQANGQAEATNKVLVDTLKRRLEDAKGHWPDELPGVLWSMRTTPRTSTGQTPFSLVYGTEAMLPVNLTVRTERVSLSAEQNEQNLAFHRDTIEEQRDQARDHLQKYQKALTRAYNKKVRIRTFANGDWVLRRAFQNTKEASHGKLAATWEGPYQITQVVGKGAYKLQDVNGKEVDNSWNAFHLKKYYF